MGERRWVRPLVLLALVAGGVIVALAVGVPPMDQIRSWIDTAGWAAPLLYAALYAALTLTPAPATVLSVGAGLLFGLATGLAVVMGAALTGATVAFALARWLGRDAVARIDNARLHRLDGLLRRRGLLAVIGIRLVPLLPFGTVNYASGLTAVRARDYVLGTAIGILPGATALVTIGAYGATPGSLPFVLAVAGLAVLAAGGLVAARRGRAAPAGPASEPAT
jgi:uncharacterized membrane protein YdjX (TVP38/TMEM64 family)